MASPSTPSSRATARARAVLAPLLRDFGADALRAWAAGLGVDHLRRQFGPRLPDRHEGRAAAARLAAPAARAGRAAAHAAPLAGLGTTTARLRFDTPHGALSVHAAGHRAGAGRRAAGRGWAPTAPGGPGCRRAASTWRRCSRPTAASTSAGANTSAAAMPAQPLKSVAICVRRLAPGRASAWSPPAASKAASSMPRRPRCAIASRATATATFELDLLPQRSLEWVARELAHPRGPRSLSTHLKTRLHLSGVKAGAAVGTGAQATCRRSPSASRR